MSRGHSLPGMGAEPTRSGDDRHGAPSEASFRGHAPRSLECGTESDRTASRSRGWKTGRCWTVLSARRRPASSLGGRCRHTSSAASRTTRRRSPTRVYNEQADPETGVLLTTTLEPGVTFAERLAAARPERAEPGLEPGDDPGLRPRQRHADGQPGRARSRCSWIAAPGFATLDAGAVSNSTPAATLQPGNVSDPSLLASTPDANTTDPFIQEEAAALSYDPTQIFNFLHDPDRLQLLPRLGARRTGHALVERGQRARRRQPGRGPDAPSGIPAQYAQGTLVAEPGPAR